MSILISGAIALFGAYVSARLAVRRGLKEKWWERKERAYAEIIDALHDLLRYAAVQAEHRWPGEEHPKEKEFSERYSEAYWRIQKATDIGAFVISDEAARILQHLRERPSLEWNDDAPEEVRKEECAHYQEALVAIRNCARKDLRVAWY